MSILESRDDLTAIALACPAWCAAGPDHHTDLPDGVYREHRAVVGVVLVERPTYPGGPQPTRVITVSLAQFCVFDRETGEIVVEQPARRVAALLVRAADVLAGGAR